MGDIHIWFSKGGPVAKSSDQINLTETGLEKEVHCTLVLYLFTFFPFSIGIYMENIPGTLMFICVSVIEAVKDYFWKTFRILLPFTTQNKRCL